MTKKKKKTKITEFRKKRKSITTDLIKIRKTVREYHEQHYPNKLDHLYVGKFIERYKLPKQIQEKVK